MLSITYASSSELTGKNTTIDLVATELRVWPTKGQTSEDFSGTHDELALAVTVREFYPDFIV